MWKLFIHWICRKFYSTFYRNIYQKNMNSFSREKCEGYLNYHLFGIIKTYHLRRPNYWNSSQIFLLKIEYNFYYSFLWFYFSICLRKHFTIRKGTTHKILIKIVYYLLSDGLTANWRCFLSFQTKNKQNIYITEKRGERIETLKESQIKRFFFSKLKLKIFSLIVV